MPPLPLLPFSTSRSAASAYRPANGKSFGQSRSVYAGSQGLPYIYFVYEVNCQLTFS